MNLLHNTDLILKTNSTNSKKTIILTNKRYIYKSKVDRLDFSEIRRICTFINLIKNKHSLALAPIVLDLGEIEFVDKLTFVILECICYDLVVVRDCKLKVIFNCKHNIYNEGIRFSGLVYLNGVDYNKFVKFFLNHIYDTHYRMVIKSNGKDTDLAFKVQDIEYFLRNIGISDEYCDSVSNVVGELIDNALEHGESDCLVDIDVTSEYVKNGEEKNDNTYCGINIVVLNFSNKNFGDELKDKFNSIADINKLPSRYLDVSRAKEEHTKYFDSIYSIDDFYAVASFQNKISGRKKSITGGTGLTQLIKILEDKADDANCYVIFKNKAIKFKKECLVRDDDEWVGFNKVNNFFQSAPDKDCYCCSGINMPGMAYNLNIVVEKRES